jgi:dihydrofolate synthase/folylpolyglutamate synthase
MKAEPFTFGNDFIAHNIRIKNSYTLFNFKFHNFKLKNLKIHLKGKHQIENASEALAAVILLKKKGLLGREIDFNRGLKEAYLRGRFEVFRKRPLVVMDIAHNPSSFSVLAQNLKLYFPYKKVILIFAASKDKDVKNMLNKIRFSNLILTTFNNPRAFNPDEIAGVCKVKNALIAKDIKEAFNLARELFERDSMILISGSLFLVSEANMLLGSGGFGVNHHANI